MEFRKIVLMNLRTGKKWRCRQRMGLWTQQGKERMGQIERVALTSEKAMAPHSSTLAWKIPWTEGPGRLQSMGSLGVRHD